MTMNTFMLVLRNSFQSLSAGILVFLPKFIVGTLLILLGWVIASSFEKVLVYLADMAKVDAFLERTGLRGMLSRVRMRLNSGLFFGGMIKWFIFLAFLLSGLEAMGLNRVNTFVYQMLFTIVPQVVAAVLALFFAVIISRVIRSVTFSFSYELLGEKVSKYLATAAFYSVWVFALSAVAPQMGIDAEPAKIIFIGAVTGLSLAFGLSFGIGGKEAAGAFLERCRGK